MLLLSTIKRRFPSAVLFQYTVPAPPLVYLNEFLRLTPAPPNVVVFPMNFETSV